MQLSVLFSALISFVILAAASPTPRAISIEELSSKRKELDTNSQRDLLEEGITKKRDELDTGTIIYAWYDGPCCADKKREELETNFVDYDPREELENNYVEYYSREELENNYVEYYSREELETNFVDYDPREELAAAIDYVG